MTIVVPPPGVSSMTSSPPTAFTKPLGDRQPESDTGAVRVVAEPLERLEHALAIGRRDARAGVDHAQMQIVPPTSAASTRTGLSSGENDSALSIRLATARSSSVGSTLTRGNVSGTSTSMRSGGTCRPTIAAGDDLLDPDRLRRDRARCRFATGSCRAGCRQECSSRSASSSIVCEQFLRRSRVPVDLVAQQTRR